MQMRRGWTIAFLVFMLLPIVLVAALVVLAQSEWGERRIEAMASKSLDRQVEIHGISLKWGWPPGIIFGSLRISNPDWAQTKDLIEAEGLYARVDVAPLLAGKVVMPYLGARRATAGLEMDGDKATWKFATPKGDGDSRLFVQRIYLDDGHIRFIDKPNDSDLNVEVKGGAGAGQELRATAKGKLFRELVTASARIPALSPQHEGPIAFDGEARIGKTEGTAAGSVTAQGTGLDINFQVAGPTLQELSKISRMILPDTPPFRLSGHLVHAGDDWNVDNLQGRIGDSDIAGTVDFKQAKKPMLRADLRAKLLDFNDLGPLIGAPPGTGQGETASAEQKQRTAKREAQGRMLPDKEFDPASWGKMDADVKLVAQKIQRPKQLPLEAFSAHVLLKDSVMTTEPLEFGVAGGRIVVTATLDGRPKLIKAQMRADVKGLQLGRLFPTAKAMQDALGTLYGRTELTGTGQSIGALMGSSNGKASFIVEGGQASEFLLEIAELDIANVVMLLGKKSEQEKLRCAVSGFDVVDGVATANSFVVDTEGTEIAVSGFIDMKQETLDMAAVPNAKHSSFFSLRTPIHLAGPMRHPKVRPEAVPLIRKGALALGLGAVNPALAVFALYEPARGKDQPCAELVSEAKKRGAGAAKDAKTPKDPGREAVAEEKKKGA